MDGGKRGEREEGLFRSSELDGVWRVPGGEEGKAAVGRGVGTGGEMRKLEKIPSWARSWLAVELENLNSHTTAPLRPVWGRLRPVWAFQ